MSRQDTSRPNRHAIAVGASGSGKTTWIRQEIKRRKPERLLVWDPDEDHDCHRLHSRAEFAQALAAAHRQGKRYRLGLVVPPTRANFAWWCRTVWTLADARRPIQLVVEELADVTTVAKAAPEWGAVCRRGRKYGLDWIAATQRPQECDKTAFNQAATRWCGVLQSDADRKRMAAEIDRPVADLAALQPLEYFHREGPAAASRHKLKIR